MNVRTSNVVGRSMGVRAEEVRTDEDTRTVCPDDRGVATIAMTRTPVNHLSVHLVRSVANAVERLSHRDDCRVILLRSTGEQFCAGWDHEAPIVPGEDGGHLYAEAARVIASSVPIVAAIDGPTAGGGVGLALIADFRVMGPRASIDLYFARRGRFPGMGISLLLPRLVGNQRAAEILSRSRVVYGPESERIGLCDVYVAAADEFDAAVDGFVADVARSHPRSIQEIRHAFRHDLVERYVEATRRELAHQNRMRAEGIHT